MDTETLNALLKQNPGLFMGSAGMLIPGSPVYNAIKEQTATKRLLKEE